MAPVPRSAPRRAPRAVAAGLVRLVGLLAAGWAGATNGVAQAPLPLPLTAPLDYQVVQQNRARRGEVPIGGAWSAGPAGTGKLTVEARLHREDAQGWSSVPVTFDAAGFSGRWEAPAGGWYRIDVRLLDDGRVEAEGFVEHVGVGEMFVVAGQSNSANHGEERQSTTTGKVASFDGTRWQPAHDPQPGASGDGGSFLPPFGDGIARRFDVPVGLIACGLGGTSVREWLPKGVPFPDPPTVESRVARRPDGRWESDGEAFGNLVRRLKQPGPRGFRAVLWHQGESDANQKDPTRTLPGLLYREFLETILRESRERIGWDAPWFVAQVSYHVPGDESSPEIRAAQRAVVESGLALAGPDSDALGAPFRDGGGQGVHFSGAGLRELAARWVDRVAPWLERELTP